MNTQNNAMMWRVGHAVGVGNAPGCSFPPSLEGQYSPNRFSTADQKTKTSPKAVTMSWNTLSTISRVRNSFATELAAPATPPPRRQPNASERTQQDRQKR